MRFPIILTVATLLGACGQSNEQSDPAAAAVLNNAAEAGTPPQEAGNAAAEADTPANVTTNRQ